MEISQKEYNVNGVHYTLRSVINNDAKELSEISLQIDGETQNLDREKAKHT